MRADYISRNVDFDDRKVPPSIFAWLDSQYIWSSHCGLFCLQSYFSASAISQSILGS